MQKSQLEAVDSWPAPLIMRTRSGNGRDKKKVSCETLSKVDWYSRRPHEAQLYYHSDDDEEENPASEAEDDHENGAEVEDDKEDQRDYTEKLASHAYGEGFSAQGRLHFLQASSHSKAPQGRSAMALSSPGRDAKKTERMPRTYPSPVPHSGSLLPPSGRILPHSGPIKLHVGSHANTHTIKVSSSTRGSSLIPSNIVGKSSKSSGFGNANEPSSPKVTCFGRVKIKQKYCREMGRLADMSAVGASNDKVHKLIGDQMMKLTRRKHNAHAVEKEAAPTEEGLQQKPLGKEADMSSRVEVRREDEKRTNMVSSSSASAGTMSELQKSRHGWGSHREDPTADSDSKGQKGKWRLKEPGARMKFRGADKKKWQPPDAEHSFSQADSSIDLNRFCSSQRPEKMADKVVSKSLASLSIDDESLVIEQMEEDPEFLPPVPPANSLLLMRNSKCRGACVTMAASSTGRRRGTDTYEQAVLAHMSQVPSLALKEKSLSKQQLSSSLLGGDTNERDFAIKANGHARTASFAEIKVMKMFAVAPAECTPLQVKTNLQVSLSKTPPEGASLWERRSIMRPSTIDVGKP